MHNFAFIGCKQKLRYDCKMILSLFVE